MIEKKTEKQFPFTEEVLDGAYEWICSQYETRKQEWERAAAAPFLEADRVPADFTETEE